MQKNFRFNPIQDTIRRLWCLDLIIFRYHITRWRKVQTWSSRNRIQILDLASMIPCSLHLFSVTRAHSVHLAPLDLKPAEEYFLVWLVPVLDLWFGEALMIFIDVTFAIWSLVSCRACRYCFAEAIIIVNALSATVRFFKKNFNFTDIYIK